MPAHNFERPRGRTLEIQIDSEALRGNLLGDPSVRRVAVYLPEGYDGSDRDYPLFVDLAGFTGSGLKRLAWTAFGESVPQRIDRLVAEGAMGPVVVAFPDAFTSLGGNQYIDSVAMGAWSTFLVHELVPRLQAELRVRRGPRHTAVLGKSSGGYGALVQGMTGPGTWGAVACHSGDMAFELVYQRDFPATCDVLARHGGIPEFLAHVRAATKLRGDEMHALMILAMGATYDPDPTAPCGVRLPVDLRTARLDPARWAAWLAHDPIHMLETPSVREALSGLRGLWIDCGRRDQYFLHYGARTLCAELARLGIAHEYEEFDDDHSNVDYRLDRSLPFLFRAVSAG